MRCTFNLFCILFMVFSLVNCDGNEGNSLWGRFTSGVNKVKNFIFTPENDYIEKNTVQFFIVNGSSFESEGRSEGRSAGPTRGKGKIFLIIHGYMSGRHSWYANLTERILFVYPDAVVAQVSWEGLAYKLYSISKRYTEQIGMRLARIIVDLKLDHAVDTERFILIGHSLGAQICGWAGRFYQGITGMKLQRIIALDPAQPLFKHAKEKDRLNANDAEAVIVIHTSGFFGFQSPCGTVDFYVNGGQTQNICHTITNWQEKVYCGHTSSYKYFMDAVIHPQSYIGIKCKNLEDCKNGIVEEGGPQVSMGDLQLNENGLYFVKTPDN